MARFIEVCVTPDEAKAARKVRAARDAFVRGQAGQAALDLALIDPHIAILLSEIADTWDNTPADEGDE